MGGAGEYGIPPNLLIRLQERIVSISFRADQLQRMVNTTFVDFRAIWQLINNDSINDSALIDELIEQLAEKVSEMQGQVTKGLNQNAYPTYYNDIEPFNEAETNLKELTENNGQLSNAEQMNKIKQIVSKMWAKANLKMIKNVSDNLLEGNSYFFGFTILFEFGKQMLAAERMIYKGFLNETTLEEAIKQQLINAYKQLVEKSVALYESWKLHRVMRLENIGIKLKREMAALNLSAADHSWDQFLSGQATIKSGTLIDQLLKVENLFSKYQYELDMVDLKESANILWHKLDEANQLIKAIKFAFDEDEEMEVYNALLHCLDIDKLLKHIESESDQMANKELL
ncbi:hypothetical protein niasHS_013911 [Heterodera schachtii]|uniref:Uncharacterized protein n=1 Tax=Heterodera schachtii TaxID=97005 RepID=A0ABD2IHQ1_HETSC